MSSCIYVFNSTSPDADLNLLCFEPSTITSWEEYPRSNSTALFSGNVGPAVDINDCWVLIAGSMVFFMQCGFTMLEAGSVKSRSVQNILFKNLMDACVGVLVWWLFGYAVAYGVSGENGFIGTENVVLQDETWIGFFFQWAFAATAATIVSGSVAERCTLVAYFLYTTILTVFVYPVVVHWIWDEEGWLSAFNASPSVKGGVVDFAGSGVVHMVGGFSGLMGAIALGPRTGRFPDIPVLGSTNSQVAAGINAQINNNNDDGKDDVKENGDRPSIDEVGSGKQNAATDRHEHSIGNSVPFQVLGCFILWFGWYGFNCGSTLGANGLMELASKVAVNSTLSAAAGGLTCVTISVLIEGFWSVPRVCNGILAGLVSITAPCATTDPADSIAIGALGGVVYVATSRIMEKLRIDDPLDAFAVHGMCGLWGVMCAAIFSSSENLAYAGYNDDLIAASIGHRLSNQLVAILSIIAWTVTCIGALFFTLKFAGVLRISRAAELVGADSREHGGSAINYGKVYRKESASKGKAEKQHRDETSELEIFEYKQNESQENLQTDDNKATQVQMQKSIDSNEGDGNNTDGTDGTDLNASDGVNTDGDDAPVTNQ